MSENTFSNINNSWQTPRPKYTPFLEDVLADNQPIPPHSIMLGQCEDKLPLLLDLTDPQPGSFLITSDHGFANTLTLHSIITSAYILNNSKELIFHLISPFVDDLHDILQQKNFRIGLQPGRPECEITLEELVNLAKHRQPIHKIFPTQILAIDSLDILLKSLPPESVFHLNWLIENGPAVGIWVIATLESQYIQNEFNSTLINFSSKIIGQTLNPSITHQIAGRNDIFLENLKPGKENLVISGSTLIDRKSVV